jgi:hypothetical protein
MDMGRDFLTRLDVPGYNDGIPRLRNDRTNRLPVRWLKKFRTVEYPGHTHLCISIENRTARAKTVLAFKVFENAIIALIALENCLIYNLTRNEL